MPLERSGNLVLPNWENISNGEIIIVVMERWDTHFYVNTIKQF